MAFVGCVIKTRPRKFVFARTYGSEAAWSTWKLFSERYQLHGRGRAGATATIESGAEGPVSQRKASYKVQVSQKLKSTAEHGMRMFLLMSGVHRSRTRQNNLTIEMTIPENLSL